MEDAAGQGHFILREEQVKSQSPARVELLCGCVIMVSNHDPRNHTWTFLLDYSRCSAHQHGDECRPTMEP